MRNNWKAIRLTYKHLYHLFNEAFKSPLDLRPTSLDGLAGKIS